MATAGLGPDPGGMPSISGSSRTAPQMGVQNADRAAMLQQQYVTPSFHDSQYTPHVYQNSESATLASTNVRPASMPAWYPTGTGQLPVSYVGPSAAKDDMVRRESIREGIKSGGAATVVRTDPIQDSEVQYLKYMEDMSELAKFDQYVESFIDPRQPGSMKFLMEVYPEYVNRRLQQAHADYEYALRNQMIDSWGINTFDDLYFKYMVDQGKLDGPTLKRGTKKLDDNYAPGILSPWAFATKFDGMDKLGLPFNSAKTGRQPDRSTATNAWEVKRTGPFSEGGSRQAMAAAMYGKNLKTGGTNFNDPASTLPF
jgi:hypothetical protein